jgi:ATP-dependent DNA helicase RecG
MAPTEILAEQHFAKLVGWLAPLGITTAWLSGSRKGRTRRDMLERIASGEAGLVVGTHAVIQDDVQFARLGLAIVDEQHRFGVAQRLALRKKLVIQEGPSHVRGRGGEGLALLEGMITQFDNIVETFEISINNDCWVDVSLQEGFNC